MNKQPINYLIAIAFGAILWVVTAIFLGGSFSESLILAVSTPEEFLVNFRIILGIAACLGIITCVYWFWYGNLESTAGNLQKAKTKWWSSFILLLIAAVGLLFTLVFINLAEGILTTSWLISFSLISLHTWLYYWFLTFFVSPRTVKYIPLFK